MSEAQRIRVIVVDDEPMARSTLEDLIGRDPEVELVATCANGVEAVAAVREHAPDLMVLDVEMPEMGGFDVLDELGEHEVPVVVFATAYDQFALRAFEVHAVDYLLKPFDDERFELALGRAKDRVRSGNRESARITKMLEAAREESVPSPDEPLTRISIHREGGMELVDVDSVVWIQAADQYVRIHTTSGEHLMRESMGRLERQLDPNRFMRVHRSTIVALDRVRRLESLGGGLAKLLVGDDTWLPVSRSRAPVVRRRLG